MFNMQGHKIEFTGPPSGLREVGQADESAIREFVGHSIGFQEITMVCWGEDMARVPLLIWTGDGDIVAWVNDMLTEPHMLALVEAGERINRVIAEENAAAIKATS